MIFKCQKQGEPFCTSDADYRVWYFSCGGLYGYCCKVHLAQDILETSKLNKDTVSQIEYLFKDEVRALLTKEGQNPDFTFTSLSTAAPELFKAINNET